MKVSGKRNTIYEYDVLRTIVTVLVVLGHSKSYTIMTKNTEEWITLHIPALI